MMYGNTEVIRYLQANNILAIKLDHAVSGAGKMISEQLNTIQTGAKRALYYTSCFTDEYNDVCQKQKSEDIRFKNCVIRLLQHYDVTFEMLKIYFEEILKYKTSDQLEHIKQMLMGVNVHIAASSLTNAGFTLAVASAVRMGLNISLDLSILAGRRAGGVAGALGVYGIVQKAADSAHRLSVEQPPYYAALYSQELEMMYFLIEPTFQKAGAFEAQWASDYDVAEIISRMIQ
jgi:hypothetical protein